jgi:hypothetical protein
VLKVLRFSHNLLIVAYIAITPCLLLDLLQISNIIFFSKSMHVSGYVPLMVEHVARVVVFGGRDQPITTCTSLGKSTNTTPSASPSGTPGFSNSRLVSVKVPNVPINIASKC